MIKEKKINLRKVFVSAIMLLICVAGLFFVTADASAQIVDVELVLAVDASGSVSSTEYNLMMQGYANVFNPALNPDIVNIIQGGTNGSIAVSLFLWSEGQKQLQDGAQTWWLINNATSSKDFSDAINGMIRPAPTDTAFYDGGTYISTAISYATGLFSNGYTSSNLVIDVSGEGDDDTGTTALNNAVIAALAAGVTKINGIVVETSDDLYPDGYLYSYYHDHVLAGTNPYLDSVSSYAEFSAAIEQKIENEIAPAVIPEPLSMMLFGSGFLGLLGLKRRKG